jgi:serine protease Do
VLLAIPIWFGPARAHVTPDNFEDLVDELLSVVVDIRAYQRLGSTGSPSPEEIEEFFRPYFRGEEPHRREIRFGSGFIIDSSGYIVTVLEVIEDADEITVQLHNGTTLEAEVIARDEMTNLALLKVASDKPLPAAEWGDSNEVRVGNGVLAIGNPFGLGGSVTAGIVSARNRDLWQGLYDDFIQTDAAVSRGNSGGPLFNLDGQVIGINSVIVPPAEGSASIGFAIASNLARNVIEQLQDHGRVRRGWLGVRIQDVTEKTAEGLRLKAAIGALIATVIEGGPADAAGVEQGDVILRFDGREVTNMRKFPRMLAEAPIGKTVEVVVWRKGGEVVLNVEVGELEEEK